MNYLWTFEVGFVTKMEVLETAFAESSKSCDLFNYFPPEEVIELSTLICQSMYCLVQEIIKLYKPAFTSLPLWTVKELFQGCWVRQEKHICRAKRDRLLVMVFESHLGVRTYVIAPPK
jgi:hypothetical protein